MTETATIEEREDGPLVVKHLSRLTAEDGTEVEVKEVIALCRCGGSSNKPFCDGTHNKIGFSGTSTKEPSGKDKIYSFRGAEVLLTYNPRLCSHAAECVTRAPAAFDPARRPWIDADAASRSELDDVVKSCPSGALMIADLDENPMQLVAETLGITIEENGPYRVTGVAIDHEPAGEGGSAEKFVLCRCGQSGSKPFCDGSHRDAGWKSS